MKRKIGEIKSEKLKKLVNERKKEFLTYAKFKSYDPRIEGSKLSIRYWWNWYKLKRKATDAILVNMELRNGKTDQFIAYLDQPFFKYKDGLYVIDDELKYFHIPSQLFALDYHQDLSLPIRRKVKVNSVFHLVESMGLADFEVETALNPHSLRRWLESDVVQKIIKGQQLDEFMRRLFIVALIAAIAAVGHLLLFVQKTGMLQGIKVPFIG